eukprot:2216549-Amphidinium_carterae.1
MCQDEESTNGTLENRCDPLMHEQQHKQDLVLSRTHVRDATLAIGKDNYSSRVCKNDTACNNGRSNSFC